MRFYKIKDGNVAFAKSIATAAQAKNHKDLIVASVTTKLSDYPNSRMNYYRYNKIMEIARELPGADLSKILALSWGETKCLATHETISSADFGTNVHASIEKRLEAIKDRKTYDLRSDPYLSHSDGFIEYVKRNKIEVLFTEHAIGCPKLMLAATADFIGLLDKKICLWDFKCRGGKGLLRTRAYDKDCAQLAVTAYMIKEKLNLDYMPTIFTVPIDRETGETYVKKWTEKKQAKCLRNFLAFNTWWNLENFDCESGNSN